MELKIESRNFNLGRRLDALVTRKMEQLLRHLPAADEARVEIIHEPSRSREERYLARASVNIKGTVIRAERRGPSALSATHSAAATLTSWQRVSRARSTAASAPAITCPWVSCRRPRLLNWTGSWRGTCSLRMKHPCRFS